MILYINACVRKESRTKRLADFLLSKLDEPYTEVRLADIDFPVTDEAYLAKRDQLIAAEEFSNPMFSLANQFASADSIVIAAPYWDLSFPAALKQYFEHINALGVTFTYTPEGFPKGLCQAKILYYVTSAGGDYVPTEFGFGYVKALAQDYYGISDVRLIRAAGLDLDGADQEQIMQDAFQSISDHLEGRPKSYTPQYDPDNRCWKVDFTDRVSEEGDLLYVVSEFARSGLYFPYNDSSSRDKDYAGHAHHFEEVLRALLEDPEGFSIRGLEEYYSLQEQELLAAVQNRLKGMSSGND